MNFSSEYQSEIIIDYNNEDTATTATKRDDRTTDFN